MIEIKPGVSIMVFCDSCKKEFAIRPGRFKIHKHHFCSIKCRKKFQRGKNREYQTHRRE